MYYVFTYCFSEDCVCFHRMLAISVEVEGAKAQLLMLSETVNNTMQYIPTIPYTMQIHTSLRSTL